MKATTTLPILAWPPSNKVIPFPMTKRRDLIERTARSMAFRGKQLGSHDPAATGEKLLQAALKAQRATMEKRGIALETIERELQQFETAVRMRAALLPDEGGAA